jgi:predicted DNA-binding protein (MmcQ/YjbR family)
VCFFDPEPRYAFSMSIEWVREFCLSLPHTTEQVQWEDALVFKLAGKMYAVARLEPGAHWLSMKCSDEEFAELAERPGIIPAPYLARAHWIALESEDTLPRPELQQLLVRSHAIVLSKLPKKTQAALAARKPRLKHPRSRKAPTRHLLGERS